MIIVFLKKAFFMQNQAGNQGMRDVVKVSEKAKPLGQE